MAAEIGYALSGGGYRDATNTTLESDPDNAEAAHQLIMSLEPQLRADWERFQLDPHFMVIK